jgi:5-methylcytosine-specific restriction endonuclease McrA
MKAYQNRWLANRRAEWIKANGPCKHCGTWENLEVDHINPVKKKYEISRIWSRKKSFRERELAKCQVLCKLCHLKKSAEESRIRNKKKAKASLKKSTS